MTAEEFKDFIFKVGIAVGCFEIISEFLVILIVTILLLKRGWLKMMPFRVKLTMAFFTTQNLFMFAMMIYFVFIESDFKTIQDEAEGNRIVSFGSFISSLIHWVFTFHYFYTAELFELLFNRDSRQKSD